MGQCKRYIQAYNIKSQIVSNCGLTNRTAYIDLSDEKTFEIQMGISYYQTRTKI